jgi:hypothetical protein
MTAQTLARSQTKARRSLTLDAEIAEYLDASGNASGTANELLREGLAARRRQAALADLVADLVQINGPADETIVAEAADLLTR